jgi:hypothetical protein
MPFMLTNARLPEPALPSQHRAAARRSVAKASYRLDGTESTLTPHVGHKVEITGTLEDSGQHRRCRRSRIRECASGNAEG